MKRALICGVSGQDGAYLASFLLQQGYDVAGTSRDVRSASFENLVRLRIREKVTLLSVNPTDFPSVQQAIEKVEPDEVYNLAGQSSVGLSFERPVETMESISVATLNLLEAIRSTKRATRFFNPASGECFGDTGGKPADEGTPLRPESPYAVAKAAAFWLVASYREAYSMHACSGILFNHESPLRPERFVTKKIIRGAWRIANGSREKLHLGNLSIKRDWGWAPEYVQAMLQMLQQPEPQDFVIATGETQELTEFLDAAFSFFGLKWQDHVVTDPELIRPADLAVGMANPEKARRVLGWKAEHKMRDVVRMMCEDVKQQEGG
jgi:GDPmannose 4,6-dehydratase